MPDDIELEIGTTGVIRTIYKDGDSQDLAKDLEASIKVDRASNVEWEQVGTLAGWTVRSAHNPNLAIRFKDNATIDDLYDVAEIGALAVFTSRFEALKNEVKLFWKLLPKENT